MLFCCAVFAQQNVNGVVIEEATSEPLAGAAVQVKTHRAERLPMRMESFPLAYRPDKLY